MVTTVFPQLRILLGKFFAIRLCRQLLRPTCMLLHHKPGFFDRPILESLEGHICRTLPNRHLLKDDPNTNKLKEVLAVCHELSNYFVRKLLSEKVRRK